MIIEYMLKFDMVITFVSLFTIIMLLMFSLPVPLVLLWIFGVSLLFLALSLLLIRFSPAENNRRKKSME